MLASETVRPAKLSSPEPCCYTWGSMIHETRSEVSWTRTIWKEGVGEQHRSVGLRFVEQCHYLPISLTLLPHP